MNPYYDSDKLSWEKLEASDGDLSYEFNILCFWKTKKGLIFTASDSGCSCPTPFEYYEGNSEIEIEQQLERVGSYEQAERIVDAWNKGCSNKTKADVFGLKNQLRDWLKDSK